jgi:hypothetical protein
VWATASLRLVSRTRCNVLHVAAQSRDPCPASTLKDGPRLCRAPSRGRCAASGARTNRLRINPDPTFKQWTHLRLLAAHFARALPDRIALVVTRAQGRPGAGWHPGPCAGRCTRGGPQVSQSPGLPCAMVYGLLRALLGERCTIAPVAERIADAHARSGSNITAGLDAQTPGVRTTRLDRPRTSSLGLRELACAHARSHAKTLSASCRTRGGDCSRQGRPAIPIAPDAVASIATLPAVRDDRDPSLVSDRVVRVYGKSEFR